jgi:hypothetical protein
MKKAIFLSLLLCSANASAGNVGIGTTTPGDKLEVNGGITASSITVKGDLGIKTYSETQSSETISGANYNLE